MDTTQGCDLSGDRHNNALPETGTKEGKGLLSSCRCESRIKFLQRWAGRVSPGVSAARPPLQGSSLPRGCEYPNTWNSLRCHCKADATYGRGGRPVRTVCPQLFGVEWWFSKTLTLGSLHTTVDTAVAMVVLQVGSGIGFYLFYRFRDVSPDFGMIANSSIMSNVFYK
jgi:hypothetical protein